jgi:hypothetical protein
MYLCVFDYIILDDLDADGEFGMGVSPVGVELFVGEGVGFREEDGEFCYFFGHGEGLL